MQSNDKSALLAALTEAPEDALAHLALADIYLEEGNEALAAREQAIGKMLRDSGSHPLFLRLLFDPHNVEARLRWAAHLCKIGLSHIAKWQSDMASGLVGFTMRRDEEGRVASACRARWLGVGSPPRWNVAELSPLAVCGRAWNSYIAGRTAYQMLGVPAVVFKCEAEVAVMREALALATTFTASDAERARLRGYLREVELIEKELTMPEDLPK